MQQYRTTARVAVVFALGLAVAASAQAPIDELAVFEPFANSTWVGRFQDPRAPRVDHVIEWNAILDGQVVRWTKYVEALGFSMETTFYWDWEIAAVSFVQLASNGSHAQGVAMAEGDRLVLLGVSAQPLGSVEFRQTFEIMADETLEDRYYRRAGEGWAPQHVIVYRRLQKAEAG